MADKNNNVILSGGDDGPNTEVTELWQDMGDGTHARRVAISTAAPSVLPPNVDSYSQVSVSLAADTANQQILAAPGAGKQIWVFGGVILADTGAGTIAFQDEDDTALTGAMALSDEGGFSISPSGNFAMPIWKLPTNKALEADTVTCSAAGWLDYAIVDVS